jgi:hypothetical protein
MGKLQNLNEKKATGFTPAEAWWISPDGKILGFNTENHIKIILEHPEVFGFTKEYLEKTYKKFKEPYGFEGMAREEIIKNSITKKGWIRIRHYGGKEDRYSIQIGNLDTTRKDYIWWWASAEIKDGYKPNDWPDAVYIDILNEKKIITTSLKDIINDSLLEESEKKGYKKRLQENKPEFIETPQQFSGISPAFKRMHSKLREEEKNKRYNSQYCIDQCFRCLSNAIHTLTQSLKLTEATAGGGVIVERLNHHIQKAAAWYKHLVKGYNENELIIKEIKSEISVYNDIEIPYFNKVAIACLKNQNLDAEDREIIHKQLVQIKQILDGLNNIISKYLAKMHISDTALKLDQLNI